MLIVGTDKSPILDHLPEHFLLIDDGQIIDELKFNSRKKISRFDPRVHSYNPLKSLDYKGARDFVSILDAVFPEGENTLTKKNSNFVLLNALLERPKRLDTLLAPSDDPAIKDAYQKIQTLLLSPVLKNVLSKPTNFPMRGTVLVRLNRAELGDFDCFVLGNFLMAGYQGHVVVPDFGFYAAPHHIALVRQNRLLAGVNFLDELPAKLRVLLTLGSTQPSHCSNKDAETLASGAGVPKDTNAYTDFIHRAMG